ncbi:MAG: hypothetical protein WDM94_05605 [Bauldia sp.]
MRRPFDKPVELIPRRLYAIGGMVPLDGKVSWVPAAARGFQPMNSYLLLEDRYALLIDTGLPYHEAQVLDQLGQVLPQGYDLSIYLTRYEMDCVGNVGPIAMKFGISHLYTGGVFNPFDGFDQISSIGEDRGAVEDRVSRVKAGNVLEIGKNGRTLEVITAPFKMLTAYWGYDAATETMFTSDMFGQHIWPEEAYHPVATEADDKSTAESVADAVRARYWWLDHINPAVLLERFEALVAQYKISRIAPTHGSVVSGPVLVQRHIQFIRQLLTPTVSQESKRRVSA